MTDKDSTIDFNKILLFGSWAIPSRMFGWGFLGLLCGFAAFSSLRLSGTLEFVDPNLGPWIYLLLMTYALLGLGILGRVGYQRGLFLVSLYALKSPGLTPFLLKKLQGDLESGEENLELVRSKINEHYQSILSSSEFEDLAGQDGPVTGYRAEVVLNIKQQLSSSLGRVLIEQGKPGELSTLTDDSELVKSAQDKVEQQFQSTLKRSSRIWMGVLIFIYALTPAVLVFARG